jgi:drug/metabolite transporter (DMT)-like permease
MDTSQSASALQICGAACFGALIGWYVYYINRYRRGDVQLSDLVTLIGVLGGSAVLVLFPARTDLFGAYGIGLAIGFFGYFLALLIMVSMSRNFDVDWFLDGRRRPPDDAHVAGGDVDRAMHASGERRPN